MAYGASATRFTAFALFPLLGLSVWGRVVEASGKAETMGYPEAIIIAQTSGFAIGTALAALLLALVLRSGGDGRGPRFLFALCILIANCAGLIKNLALVADPFFDRVLEYRIRSIGFAAAAFLPYCILLVWERDAVTEVRRRIGRYLALYACLSGFLIGIGLIVGSWASIWVARTPALQFLLNQDAVGNMTFYNGLMLFSLGGFALLPGTLGRTIDRVAVTLMLTGLLLSTVSTIVAVNVQLAGPLTRILDVARFQSIILLVIGVVIYFSRFRAADIFAKWAFRILLVGSLAMAGVMVLFGPVSFLVRSTALPPAAGILSTAAVLCIAILVYQRAGSMIDVFVERQIFGKRDPRLLIRDFQGQLGSLISKADVISAARLTAAQALAMKLDDVRVEPPPSSPNNPDARLSIPILAGDNALQMLVSPAGNRRVFLTREIDLLREVALHTARRLDDLEHELERIERIRLEGRLSQQLVEAELRALRAQVNPHFLFNSLNTIASLIVSEPDKAEKITVRLSSMFRYVLIHADQPLSSLGEELEFLRTFLDIEQIRFGDRLHVDFDAEPSLEFTPIPSLILQPLVENSIKHGIAPKIGRSRITVRARKVGDVIRVEVEDDGVGLHLNGPHDRRPLRNPVNAGVGLKNIAERLEAMYGKLAALSLEDLASGGCRATVKIPLNGANDGHSSISG